MTIKNILWTDSPQAIFFPVVCTANLPISVSPSLQYHRTHLILSKQAINTYLSLVHAHDDSTSWDCPHTLNIIHDLKCTFDGPTSHLESSSPTSSRDPILQTPFLNKPYPQIKTLLDNIVEKTNSKLDTECFLVLDDQSEATQTAVMVNVDRTSNEVQSLRVEYAISARDLAAASVAHPDLEEMAEHAGGWDGVSRA
jgi:hypothetical protein